MAHPYSTDDDITHFMGSDLRLALQQFDSTVTVATVLSNAREDAENYIDSKLAKMYEVPFAAVTDTPSTPGIIRTLSKNLTAYELLKKRHPKVAKPYLDEALGLLEELKDGEADIPGAALVDADEAAVGLDFEDVDPDFSARDDDDVDNMSGW